MTHIIKTKYLPFVGLILLSLIYFVSCKPKAPSPIINPSVIKFKVKVRLVDVLNATTVPAGAVIRISGTDSAKIFDISGSKTITIDPQGNATVGVDPNYKFTGTNVLKFNIDATASGYDPVSTPIMIDSTMKEQSVTLSMLNTANLPPEIVSQPVNISIGTGGTTTSPISISTPTTGGGSTGSTGSTTAINIPTGTQFRDVNGNIITGTTLTGSVKQFDFSQGAASVLASIPGGGSVQNNIVSSDPTKKSVVFTPASMVSIDLFLDGKKITGYSNPITVGTTFPAAFNIATGKQIAAGDELDIYMYTIESKAWSFEKTAQVSLVNGGTTVSASFNHNSYFLFNYPSTTIPCQSTSNIKFTINDINKNLDVNSSDLYIMDIIDVNAAAGTKPLYSQYVNAHDGDVISLPSYYLPTGKNIKILLYDMDYDHWDVTDSKRWISATDIATSNTNTKWTDVKLINEITTSDYCGKSFTLNMTISKPTTLWSMKALAKCPTGTTTFTAIEGQSLFYKYQGSLDAYRLLGVVKNGTFTTRKGEVGKAYSLQGFFGNKVGNKDNVILLDQNTILNYPIVNGIRRISSDTTYIMKVGNGYCF
jgi:hypothetical protein